MTLANAHERRGFVDCVPPYDGLHLSQTRLGHGGSPVAWRLAGNGE